MSSVALTGRPKWQPRIRKVKGFYRVFWLRDATGEIVSADEAPFKERVSQTTPAIVFVSRLNAQQAGGKDAV